MHTYASQQVPFFFFKRPTDAGIYRIINSMHDRASAQFLCHQSESFARGFPYSTILNIHIIANAICKCTPQINTEKSQLTVAMCNQCVLQTTCYWLTWESEDGTRWQWEGDMGALHSTAVHIDMLARVFVFAKTSHCHTKWQWEPWLPVTAVMGGTFTFLNIYHVYIKTLHWHLT